jgi:hypothetical protein
MTLNCNAFTQLPELFSIMRINNRKTIECRRRSGVDYEKYEKFSFEKELHFF